MGKERKITFSSYHINDFGKRNSERFREEFDLDEDDDEEIEDLDNAPTVMMTGIGPVIKDDSMNPLRVIEHWMCNTNFDINTPVVSIVNAIEGVESLTVISRYKMIIGFGELFDVKGVKKEIEDKLVNIESLPKGELNRLVKKTLRETFLGNS